MWYYWRIKITEKTKKGSPMISVFGVKIAQENKKYVFASCSYSEYTENDQGKGHGHESDSTGLRNISLPLESISADTKVIMIAYDVDCPEKFDRIRNLLNAIKAKRNDLKPILISIGHEDQSAFSAQFKQQFSEIRAIAADEFTTLTALIKDENKKITIK